MTGEDQPGGDYHLTLPARADADPPAPERRIGPYLILRELGHGGMGTVYLAARADEQFHKRVALKIIRSGADSADVVRHFKRERQILAGLDHPNIAKLLDGGTTDDGLPFFVMELIEGEEILRYCDARNLSVGERLKLFKLVCSAIQYAHRNLVVHRDIKPGNILVGEDGTPRLLDFGIARLLDPELRSEGAATLVAMTPEYASPEQARGERITTASDVYSLGVVLYELLTGRLPYRLASHQPLDVLVAVSEQEPEKPSSALDPAEAPPSSLREQPTQITPQSLARTREGTPERLKRRLRGDLDNILMLALRKEPHHRYVSVEAFSDDLRRHLEGLPVLARKPTVGYRVAKFVGRNRVAVAASIALVVLFLGAAAAIGVQSARVARERDVARKERETAQQVSRFLVDLFKVSDPSEARGNSITAREALDTGAARIATELKAQPEVRATLMDTMGDVYRNLGLYARAVALLEEGLETRKALLGAEHEDVARSQYNLANTLRSTGDYARAEAIHREALDMRRKLLGNEHPDVANSIHSLANVVYMKGDYAGAEGLYRECLDMRRKLLGNEHPDVAKGLSSLANALYSRGDFAGAEPLYRESLAMTRKLSGSEHPQVATSVNNLANVLFSQGDFVGAEALYRESLGLMRKLLGDEHPQTATGMVNVASVLYERGDYAGAEALHREALALLRRLLGNEHPGMAMSMNGLAKTLCRQQERAEAEPLAREALSILRKALPVGHRDIAEAESALGACLTLSRDFPEAEALLLASYPVLLANAGPGNPTTREALQSIVRLYEDSGKSEEAARYRGQLAPTASPARR